MNPLATKGLLNFIGTGSAFNHKLGNNSAYIKREDAMLLIDCGGTVFHRIRTLDLLKDVKKLYVLITHMHPDHVGSLGDLIFYTYYMLQMKTTIIYPDLGTLAQLLNLLGVTAEFYDTQAIKDGVGVVNPFLDLKLEYVVQQHTSNLNCYGYLITSDKYKLFYSGDSRNIPDRVLQSLSDHEIDFLYQDTCSYDGPDIPHLSLNMLAQIIDPALRNKVYCMHLDPSFDTNKAKSLGFNVVEILT
ncbi:MBL fold metallo-hydrolase [Clostridium thermarum]|uniref:MBL fold metallo-hydrolase n=1 Tax=Clostridium thermarum TaxID=1716543 RepID=UPI0013D596FD|nr:MBL fold metallo-hydrolase [Clostridium thermarum]